MRKKLEQYLTTEVENQLKKYNTILTTTSLRKQLIPTTETTNGSPYTYSETKLVLIQSINIIN